MTSRCHHEGWYFWWFFLWWWARDSFLNKIEVLLFLQKHLAKSYGNFNPFLSGKFRYRIGYAGFTVTWTFLRYSPNLCFRSSWFCHQNHRLVTNIVMSPIYLLLTVSGIQCYVIDRESHFSTRILVISLCVPGSIKAMKSIVDRHKTGFSRRFTRLIQEIIE